MGRRRAGQVAGVPFPGTGRLMSGAPTMRAAYIEDLGPPEAIRVGELPVPRPGPAEVLVAVQMTPVNRVDTLVRSGAYRTRLPFPFIVGRDLVGEVAEPGSEAGRFGAGALVWCNSLGHAGRQGAAAQYALVPADRLYPLPSGVDPGLAAALVHPAATAYLALRHGNVQSGDTIVITGAAGNVGSAALVQAVRAGARVIATAGPADQRYCLGLGAAHVVDYHDRAAVRGIRALAPGGVQAYLDAAGENDLITAVDLLAPRGRVVLLAGPATRPVLPAGPLYQKDAVIDGFAISNATAAELADAARAVNEFLGEGRLRPRVMEAFPLREAAAVHRRVEQEGLHGRRFLLRP
jgi:NADPH:quinone reductase-like Zn-dependent oxidoreductase